MSTTNTTKPTRAGTTKSTTNSSLDRVASCKPKTTIRSKWQIIPSSTIFKSFLSKQSTNNKKKIVLQQELEQLTEQKTNCAQLLRRNLIEQEKLTYLLEEQL